MAVASADLLNHQQMDLSAIHHMQLAELLRHLGVEPERGLSHQQAEDRFSHVGPNALPMAAPRPTWLKFLEQFKSLLIIVLIVAAALAALVGNLKDAGVIIAVVLLNGTGLLPGIPSRAEPRGTARHAARYGQSPPQRDDR